MDASKLFKLPTLNAAQEERVATCRDACPFYVRSKVLNVYAERCRKCGCFIHLLAVKGYKGCQDGRWAKRSGLNV